MSLSDDELRNWREVNPPKGYKECPYCLHGWRRDVEPYGYDEECNTCNYTGFVLKTRFNKWLK